jgi:hypothetical protein
MCVVTDTASVLGDGGIFYLYARKKFGWDEQQYSKFQTLVICKLDIHILKDSA